MNYVFHSPVEHLSEAIVPAGRLLINWIGQAGFVFKSPGGHTLCVDPYLSNIIEKYEGLESRRMYWPSFGLERFRVDGLFLTHDHIDHTDPETLPMVEAYARPERYYAVPSSAAHLRAMNVRSDAITEVRPGDHLTFHDMVLRPVFANHTPDSVGLILECAGLKIYITGDTCACAELLAQRDEQVDVLITCINGIYNNLNVREAVDLSVAIGAKLTIPMHFGVVPSNTVRPERFLHAAGEAGIDHIILKPEEHYLLARKGEKVVADLL